MKHTCHVPGCERLVPARLLMCPPHWMMVPKEIQRRVMTHYRAEQCATGPRKRVRPSDAWMRAARDAINAVRDAEDRTTPRPR